MADLAGFGVTKVSEYRAFIMGKDGHVANCRAFVCGNDADATVWAGQLAEADDIELWSGDRLVIRLASKGKRAAVTHEVVGGRMVPKK
jgi:hypothetical protein